MNILFVTPPLAFQNIGGREIQLLKTKFYLEKQFNVKIDIFDIVKTKISDYEIIHFFGSEYILSHIIEAAKSSNKKIIVSPIFYDLKSPYIYKLTYIVSKLLPFRSSIYDRYQLFKKADYILPNSKCEKEYIKKCFDIKEEKIIIIPNGIDLSNINYFINNIEISDIEQIKKEYKINGDYILYVGRFDDRKNQLNLIKAFNKITMNKNIYLVLVGSYFKEWEYYYNNCLKEARKNKHNNIIFIPNIENSDIKLWILYKGAIFHIMPSLYETPGLSSLEAAYCGCKIIVTEGGATREYFKDNAIYVNPNNVNDIAEKIGYLLKNHDSNEFKQKLRNIKYDITNMYNWEVAAKKTYEVYDMVLNK